MSIQIKENHSYLINDDFIAKADELKRELHVIKKVPTSLVEIRKNKHYVHGWKAEKVADIGALFNASYGKGDSVVIDFGDHQVGQLVLKISAIGSPPDAPLHMRLTFGEMPLEIGEDFSTYNGWVSSSWLQQETLYVDILPQKLKLPRRYSFRYLKIEVLDTSPKYKVRFDEVYCNTITSANTKNVNALDASQSIIEDIDRVSIKTLQDCMQDIFEDGPKRDRRLWLGDLRLQALANYETFKNYDLVKRCLYLFAAVPDNSGMVSANLFVAPTVIPDDTYLFDYSLFFTVTLHDYYAETDDLDTVKDLWPTAYRQVELALERLNDKYLVEDDITGTWWSFIDWHSELNKQASSHAVLIYTLKRTAELARAINDLAVVQFVEAKVEQLKNAAREHLWDEKLGFFVSGQERQISWASQIWMVLAEVFDIEKSRTIMDYMRLENPEIAPVTPYMYHHLIDATISVGQENIASELMIDYWGGMINEGADTFWESYNPQDKNYSPYGNSLINSYCHAWSCTPTFLIRKYGLL